MAKFPNIGPKHTFTPHFSAEDDIYSTAKVPKKIILLYSKRVFNNVKREIKIEVFKSDLGKVGAITIRQYITMDKKLLIVMMPPGSPVTASHAELLISRGAKEFLILGSAGGISPKLKGGDLVMCTKAIRDEGVSHHYLKAAKYVKPSNTLVHKLVLNAEKRGLVFWKGPTWTIDAVFRETKEEILQYRKEGVLTVEMEAAALFAVAVKRKVSAAAAFTISDILYESKWGGFLKDRLKGYKQLAVFAKIFKDSR